MLGPCPGSEPGLNSIAALEDQAFLRHLMASEGNAREFKREVRSNVV